MYKQLLSGNEAVALAALDAGVALGTGYPGTPSTEILEGFFRLGGKAQWAPNEKVALEVALGAAFASARALVTMKHVGLNVAADVLFTAAYSGVPGALIVVSADDPGMASSQNEQDNRRYAVAAGVPMLEPADSQQAYDFFFTAVEISERWHIPVLFRMTTRVCHSKTVVTRRSAPLPAPKPFYERDPKGRVMIPAHARPAHRRLRQKLSEIAAWGETAPVHSRLEGAGGLGIITSGITVMHAREAAPEADIFQIGLTYPLPLNRLAAFVSQHERTVVLEEGDPYLVDALRAEGLTVEGKTEAFRFGELDVERVRRILAHDTSPEPKPLPGKPPQLCVGCPHRKSFEILSRLNCIVAGDIGCYSLGVLPPFEAMDAMVCMGASIGVAHGAAVAGDPERHIAILGDSTFFHTGIPALINVVYNRSNVITIITDNRVTGMTGHQPNPGTGKTLQMKDTVEIDL
ncbi:MAG: thiamine pyrophosphate-binding protein, partial [Candidatus Firestonebacteria bacterium]|nr:thiamine pyrophosphate-binding protein [Candidatus Firestonebacteria bacterium]